MNEGICVIISDDGPADVEANCPEVVVGPCPPPYEMKRCACRLVLMMGMLECSLIWGGLPCNLLVRLTPEGPLSPIPVGIPKLEPIPL